MAKARRESAFMREEADILVLDEPTAALDAEAERAVFERFGEPTRGRTTILISHRLPTVRMADRIVVIHGGQAPKEGTPSELVAAGGRYARLFELQAEGYRQIKDEQGI
jgi:ATP-binding cassette subfamily B protein